MCNKLIYLILFVSVLCMTNMAAADMVAYYPMNEGSGINVADVTGNGNDGTIEGNVEWVEGAPGFGLGLEFPYSPQDYVIIEGLNPLVSSGEISFAAWIKWGGDTSAGWNVISCQAGSAGAPWCWWIDGSASIGFSTNYEAPTYGTGIATADEWMHVAFSYDGSEVILYSDGEATHTKATTIIDTTDMPLYIGALTSVFPIGFDGVIDDVKFFNAAISEAEVQQAMLPISQGQASSPKPQNNASDVSRDVILSWEPGKFADKHDVYFGTNLDDVNTATPTVDPAGVYLGRIDPNYYPETGTIRLELGQTYYWRIDEVNAPQNPGTYTGDIWSFTTEPFAYSVPSENITVTASSYAEGKMPEKTIDGSGLDTNDLHSNDTADMWITDSGAPGPAWIQFEFHKVYKLNKMMVWNYNGSTILSGLGFRDVTIQYSADGTNWTQIGDVFEFPQAPGESGYASDITIDFDGATVKSVKMNPTSNWIPGFPECGLSEVRFLYIPVDAREPNPADGATNVSVDTNLSWRSGREAAEHNLYLSMDQQAVTDGTAAVVNINQTSYSPSNLDLGGNYFWRIEEVNSAETPTTWSGDTWNFSTQEYLVVDDFESYNDISEGQQGSNLVYLTWEDGYDNPTNGSAMGYISGASMETNTVHGGNQSVPLLYDNTTATSSEVTVNTNNLAIGRNWSKGNPQALVLWFYGDPNNPATEQLYVKVGSTKVVYDGDAANVTRPRWNQWNIDLAALGINLSNVSSISIGFERTVASGDSGMVFIDDIRLYRSPPLVPEPEDPGNAGLVAYYTMENNVQDSSGNSLHGTIAGTPSYIAGISGMALSLDGVDDYVNCGTASNFDITEQITLAAWVKTNDADNGEHNPFVGKGDQSYAIKHASNNSMEFFIYDGGWQTLQSPIDSSFNAHWHYVVGTFDGNRLKLYIDGGLVDSMDYTGSIATTTYPVNIGRNSQNTGRLYEGAIDEVRIYNRALTEGEILYLSNM